MEAGSYCCINNYNFVLQLKSFIANGLNCKAQQILNACALLCVP